MEQPIICVRCGKKDRRFYKLEDTSGGFQFILCYQCGEKLKRFLGIKWPYERQRFQEIKKIMEKNNKILDKIDEDRGFIFL